MIQEFVSEVTSEGELSFVFFRGKLVHTVRKVPKAGDFRVQSDFGGQRQVVQPEESVMSLDHMFLTASTLDIQKTSSSSSGRWFDKLKAF